MLYFFVWLGKLWRELNHTVKTHMMTELLMCLFLLSQGGMVIDRWNHVAPRWCRYRAINHELPNIIFSCLYICTVLRYLQNLPDLYELHIPHSTIYIPSFLAQCISVYLMVLWTIGVLHACDSGRKGKIRKILYAHMIMKPP